MVVSHDRDQRIRWALPLYHTLVGAVAEIEFACDEWLWIPMHWAGKQVPCPGDDCPFCGVYSSRLRGFSLVRDEKRLFLLELSAASEARLRGLLACSDLEFVAGLRCEVSRKHMRRPVVIDPVSITAPARPVQFASEVLSNSVAVLLGWPTRLVSEPMESWATRVESYAQRHAEVALRAIEAKA